MGVAAPEAVHIGGNAAPESTPPPQHVLPAPDRVMPTPNTMPAGATIVASNKNNEAQVSASKQKRDVAAAAVPVPKPLSVIPKVEYTARDFPDGFSTGAMDSYYESRDSYNMNSMKSEAPEQEAR